MGIVVKIGSKELNPKQLFEEISMDNFRTALTKKDEIAKVFMDYFDDEKDAAQCYNYYYRMNDESKKYNCQIAAEIAPIYLSHLGFVWKDDGIYRTQSSPKSDDEIRNIILKIYSRSILEKEQTTISCIKMSNYSDEYIELLSKYYISSSRDNKDFIDLMSVIFLAQFLKNIQSEN